MVRIALAFVLAVFAATASAGEFTVTGTSLPDRKAVYATVESTDILLARARIGGTVSGLAVDEGDRVEAEQVVAVIGDTKLALQLEALDAKTQSLQAARQQAAIDLSRAQELFKSGTVSKARLDNARTALQVADRNLAAMKAERGVSAQQGREGSVLAPGAGRMLKVHVSKGSVVLPGEVIATIAAENYILRINLPERHARFIAKGDKVLVGPRGVSPKPGEPLREGVVSLVYPEMNQGRVVADVTVEGLGDYFVGERTMVYVATGSRRAFVVPPDYIFQRYGLSYVKFKDGAEGVVQAGQPVEGGVEILSGVKDGDVVVTP